MGSEEKKLTTSKRLKVERNTVLYLIYIQDLYLWWPKALACPQPMVVIFIEQLMDYKAVLRPEVWFLQSRPKQRNIYILAVVHQGCFHA